MPPSGATPPTEAFTGAEEPLALVPLAREICRRYMAEFPDEDGRYGDSGRSWCMHDNQYLLAWAIQDARDGTVDLLEQALWLSDVLAHRNFPVERLGRDLEIAADVASGAVGAEPLATETATRLKAAAAAVREASTTVRDLTPRRRPEAGTPPRDGAGSEPPRTDRGSESE